MPGTGLPLAGNTLFGLLAAACWGGGDFGGSIAVKRGGGTIRASLLVVIVGHLASLAVLVGVAVLSGSPTPPITAAIWGISGGLLSGISLIAFYFALSGGHMGSAASVSGLLCAAVPAVVSEFTEGLARWPQFAGFALAAGAIWLIASVPDASASGSRKVTLMAAASGVGFGFYFVALKQAGLSGVLWPTVYARVGSAGICTILFTVFLLRDRARETTEARPQLNRWTLLWILGGATLDLLGNLSFMQATRLGRLDVAAVLASIYPAGTILLAALVLKERTTSQQRWGMALALPAVVLITL
ncbi:MAG: EamA family transporter [Janthinobacterium lividum]